MLAEENSCRVLLSRKELVQSDIFSRDAACIQRRESRD